MAGVSIVITANTAFAGIGSMGLLTLNSVSKSTICADGLIVKKSILQRYTIMEPMKQYSPPRGLSRARSVNETVAELDRELGIRRRCYEKWMNSGQLSMTDACDRYERLAHGLKLLKELAENLGDQADATSVVSVKIVDLPSDAEMGFPPQTSVG